MALIGLLAAGLTGGLATAGKFVDGNAERIGLAMFVLAGVAWVFRRMLGSGELPTGQRLLLLGVGSYLALASIEIGLGMARHVPAAWLLHGVVFLCPLLLVDYLDRDAIQSAIVLSALLQGVFGLGLMVFTGHVFRSGAVYRFCGLTNNPLEYVLVAGTGAILTSGQLSFGKVFRDGSRLFWVSWLVVCAVATFSRAALIAMTLGISLTRYMDRRWNLRRSIGISLSACFVVLAVRSFGTANLTSSIKSTESRPIIWRETVSSLFSTQGVGLGLGQFRYYLPAHGEFFGARYAISDPKCFFLLPIAEFGLVGLVISFLIIGGGGRAIRDAYAKHDTQVASLLVFVFLVSCTETNFFLSDKFANSLLLGLLVAFCCTRRPSLSGDRGVVGHDLDELSAAEKVPRDG